MASEALEVKLLSSPLSLLNQIKVSFSVPTTPQGVHQYMCASLRWMYPSKVGTLLPICMTSHQIQCLVNSVLNKSSFIYVLLCRGLGSVSTGSHCVAQACLQPTILLSRHPERGDYNHESPHPANNSLLKE
jgi:hypothetical protein